MPDLAETGHECDELIESYWELRSSATAVSREVLFHALNERLISLLRVDGDAEPRSLVARAIAGWELFNLQGSRDPLLREEAVQRAVEWYLSDPARYSQCEVTTIIEDYLKPYRTGTGPHP